MPGSIAHGSSNDSNLISGMFARLGASVGIRDVTDGTTNTIMVGEVLPDCNMYSWAGGMWGLDGLGNAHASTVVPINDMTTCDPSIGRVSNPDCTAETNWNYAWGFRSRHPGGAHFLFADGSVHALSENIDHLNYQRLGGRADGEVVGAF